MTPEQQKKELLESLDRAYSSLAREVGLDRADEEADRFRNALRLLIEQSDKTSVNVDKHLGFVKCPKVSREFVEEWANHPDFFYGYVMQEPNRPAKAIIAMLTELELEVEK